MNQKMIQAKCAVCVDEHGNYQIVGTSKPIPDHKIHALVEDGIKQNGITCHTLEFKVNVPVPEHDENNITVKDEPESSKS